jgi:hypothetical protein
VSPPELHILSEAARLRRHGMALATCRAIPKRVVLRLVAKGLLAESPDLHALCDGDGFMKQPERWAFAYELTTEGLKALAEVGEVRQ